MRADRLLQIVQLLRRHGRMSASDLARRLEVTPRTVLRDMDALSAAGVPVYAERGRRGGFALVPGYEPDVEQLTPDEARALFVAGGQQVADVLGLGDGLSGALRKLASGLPDDEHRWVRHVRDRIVLDAGGWLRDPDELSAMDDVTSAVLADERIRIRYQSKSASSPRTLTLDPWGLLQVGTTWYLIAAHRSRPRTYRVSRIVRVTRLSEPSRRPGNLDLQKVWEEQRAEFRRVPAVDIVLRIHRPRVPMVLRSLSVTMLGDAEALPGEPATYRVPVRDLTGAAAMLVGFAKEVTVLAPDELRHRIVDIAGRAQEHHAYGTR